MTDKQMERYNELLRLEERVRGNQCPDGKVGCAVYHGTHSLIEALQNITAEQDELTKDINWGEVGHSLSNTPQVLNDDWDFKFTEKV